MKNFFTKIRSNRGDTIVEVMISLVVLSMVIATVYAMGARSLRTGSESNQRTEAVSYAQSQVDLLINAKNNDPTFAKDFQVGQAYCLNPDGTINTSAQTNSNKLCNNYNGTQYNIGVTYASNLFTITAQWPNQDAPGGVANLNLYYKLPGVYKKALVTAGSATVAGTTATINGTVNPNGNIVTDCYFNYDTSSTYSAPTKVACTTSPGSGTTDVAVSATISGLLSNTTYFFQMCATNLVGTACSVNNGTFTTPARPTISNEGANNTVSPSGNNADLVAQVNPNGTTVSACYFEWGVTTAYGNSKNCGGTIGAGTTPVAVTVNVAPLTVGVTYHFRVVATNAAGTTTGGDHTFVTSLPAKPTVTLTADSGSSTIPYNSSTTLRWTTTNATNCTGGSAFSSGGQPNGSASTGNLTSTTSFTISCDGPGGTTVSSPPTVVYVGAPPPPPPPPQQAWLCGNFWNNGYRCVGPFGPGDYGWVESYGIQNDNLGWVVLQNTTVALYRGIYFNTYDGGDGFCATLGTSSWTPVSMWTWGIGGTSSFKVGVGC